MNPKIVLQRIVHAQSKPDSAQNKTAIDKTKEIPKNTSAVANLETIPAPINVMRRQSLSGLGGIEDVENARRLRAPSVRKFGSIASILNTTERGRRSVLMMQKCLQKTQSQQDRVPSANRASEGTFSRLITPANRRFSTFEGGYVYSERQQDRVPSANRASEGTSSRLITPANRRFSTFEGGYVFPERLG
jgi:hypothetical protein